MAEQALSTAVVADQKAQSASGALSGAWLPRLITGFVILLTWEIVVRAFAPAYVAKPTGVILAIPKVLTEPAFLQALGSTLVAVAEGLAITIVIGTILGLLMGRSSHVRSDIPRVHKFLQRDADDRRVAAVFLVVRLFERRPHRDHHLCRDIRHYDECRGRSPLGAARLSRSLRARSGRDGCGC